MENYVSYETAKLLKDIGYPQDKLISWYSTNKNLLCKENGHIPILTQDLSAPNFYDAMKYLREEKKIFIQIIYKNPDEYNDEVSCYFNLFKINDYTITPIGDTHEEIACSNYEDACNTGIFVACDWLLHHNQKNKQILYDDIQILKQDWKEYTRYILTYNNQGSCQINIYPKKQDFGGNVCIYALYINSEYRNKGIGKLLLEKAESIAIENGYNSIFLDFDLNESEDYIIKLYKKLNYKPQFISFKKEL